MWIDSRTQVLKLVEESERLKTHLDEQYYIAEVFKLQWAMGNILEVFLRIKCLGVFGF